LFYLGKTAFFVFAQTGELLAKVELNSAALRYLTHFELAACSRTGELVFVHPKQHLFMCLPRVEKVEDYEFVLEESGKTYRRERTRLKKCWKPVNYHWINPDPIRRL
jgi:hypothetical protein